MENALVYTSPIQNMWEATASEYENPYLTYISFIFTDDKPNENGQGVEKEDFSDIMKSAINMPIKMNFLGNSTGGHPGSIPIGHIVAMTENTTEDNVNQLIAEAVLYDQEFPEEVDYLRKAYAEKKAPGVSWELRYKSTIFKNGIKLFKQLSTQAATFVRNPSYGKRTALLALASNKEITDEELITDLNMIVAEISPKNTDIGGNNKVEEEKIKELEAALAAKDEELRKKDAEIADLTTARAELEVKVTSQEDVIAEFKKATVINERTQKVLDAGLALDTDPEKLSKKQDFLAGFSEEAFAEYVADLVETKKTAKLATASSSAFGLPRPTITPPANGVSAEDLIAKMKGLRNPSAS